MDSCYIINLRSLFLSVQFEEQADRDDLMGIEDNAKRDILDSLRFQNFLVLFCGGTCRVNPAYPGGRYANGSLSHRILMELKNSPKVR